MTTPHYETQELGEGVAHTSADVHPQPDRFR
jgi:hypothetical protein